MAWSFIMGVTMEMAFISMLVPVDMTSAHQLLYKGDTQ
jgi:hypothetical protein